MTSYLDLDLSCHPRLFTPILLAISNPEDVLEFSKINNYRITTKGKLETTTLKSQICFSLHMLWSLF